MYVLQLHNIT